MHTEWLEEVLRPLPCNLVQSVLDSKNVSAIGETLHGKFQLPVMEHRFSNRAFGQLRELRTSIRWCLLIRRMHISGCSAGTPQSSGVGRFIDPCRTKPPPPPPPPLGDSKAGSSAGCTSSLGARSSMAHTSAPLPVDCCPAGCTQLARLGRKIKIMNAELLVCNSHFIAWQTRLSEFEEEETAWIQRKRLQT